MKIELVLATASGAASEQLDLPPGATVAEALAASRFRAERPAALGIYGEVAAPDRVLEDGDRIDLLRPLLVDPKQARRERAAASPGTAPRR